MKYIRDQVTISWVVPPTYIPGDYAYLHANLGDNSDIDWAGAAFDGRKMLTHPNPPGMFGYGHGYYGHFHYGHPQSFGILGYGHYPYGHFAYGHSPTWIKIICDMQYPGFWIFGFALYDEFNNDYVGAPDEEGMYVDLEPKEPAALKESSYDVIGEKLVLII